ncbi:hypothetical protein JIN84_11600 [Luteolibacter yonseiensis]|uniref:Uncharacterized protein n=1 Tax=Luteolibacter yonseiensis TaxID=1144680 RepID=A0A934R6Z1_9BACT|nr:hypothetical protein [Luteolibacter yonseiensis]MBK1816259.1 hypothetical protein [Luteolibacter yonseiensis]
MAITFLNVDLEIISGEPLDAIRDAFAICGRSISVMHFDEIQPGEHSASFEAHLDGEGEDESHVTAGQKINAFCDIITAFPADARAVWDRCRKRVVDIGYQSENHCAPLNDFLDAGTLARLVDLGVHLAITIYPEVIVHESRGN